MLKKAFADLKLLQGRSLGDLKVITKSQLLFPLHLAAIHALQRRDKRQSNASALVGKEEILTIEMSLTARYATRISLTSHL